MLERYGHGGDLRTASELYGRDAEAFLDFSSNMNPYGPPAAVRAALLAFADRIAGYPDPAARRLISRLARRHGVAEESILAGNGAAELIDLAVRAVRPALTALAMPCFSEYGDAVRKIGGSVAALRLSPDNAFRLTAEAAESVPGKPDAWLIGSPNNPTGMTVEPEVVEALLDSGAFVVLDEAFLDFLPDEANRSFTRRASASAKLVVIRSMTKFYAVPGIRLGYAVGHPDTIAAMRRLQVPWSVNALAQEIGVAVLDDEPYARRTIDWLGRERPRFAERLASLGLRVYPGEANYILFAIPERYRMNAAALQAALGRRGILIRDASRFEGLDERYCRTAVKLPGQNDRLLEALAEVLAESAGEAGRAGRGASGR